MNFKESKEIFNRIKKSKKVLINLHRGPDPDSYGSALALSLMLSKMGINHSVVLTSTSDLNQNFSFLHNYKMIKAVDFERFDLSDYDLFISPDSSSILQVFDRDLKIPDNLFTITIDHHKDNEKFGDINLLSIDSSSTSEIVFKIMKDCKIDIDSNIATALLLGVMGDTGAFLFDGTTNALLAGYELERLGGDKKLIVEKFFRKKSLDEINLIGYLLSNLKLDDAGFAYASVPYEVDSKYGEPPGIQTFVANNFSNIIPDSKFGITMFGDKDDNLFISFRSSGQFDVSVIANHFNGGGHKVAAGAKITNMKFDDAVDEVLRVARIYADKKP